jgi:hypothetical protein
LNTGTTFHLKRGDYKVLLLFATGSRTDQTLLEHPLGGMSCPKSRGMWARRPGAHLRWVEPRV